MKLNAHKRLGGLLLCALSFVSIRLHAQPREIELISKLRPEWIDRSAPGDSLNPFWSGDGRFIAFQSLAGNLTTNRVDGRYVHLYLRNLQLNRTELLSAPFSSGTMANGSSLFGGVSFDGSRVAFGSDADNLVPGDDNDATDVFVRDRSLGKTLLVSVGAGGGTANAASSNPVITPDGRFVAFESGASNLVGSSTHGQVNVFVRDLNSDATTLVSARAGGEDSANGSSTEPQISDDGRFVAFLSNSTNLAGSPKAPVQELYLRDLESRTNIWVSNTSFRTNFLAPIRPERIWASNPRLSTNGLIVTYKLSNDAQAFILQYDVLAGSTRLVATNAALPDIYQDDLSGPVTDPAGLQVAYETSSTTPSSAITITPELRLWSARDGRSIRVNPVPQAPAGFNGYFTTPTFFRDGAKLAFLSNSTNLVTNLLAGEWQVYVYDIAAAQVSLAGVSPSGDTPSGYIAEPPSLSPDGRALAFAASDADVVEGDFNGRYDVFVRDLETGATKLVSERDQDLNSTTGTQESRLLALTADGRRAFFTSRSKGLSSEPPGAYSELYLRDLVARTNRLIRVAADHSPLGEGSMRDFDVTPDGRHFVFSSIATNIVAGDTNAFSDVFLHDVDSGETVRISETLPNRNGYPPNCFLPSISEDGRRVAFLSLAANFVERAGSYYPYWAHVFDRDSGRVATANFIQEIFVSADGKFVRISPDGGTMVYASVDSPIKGDPHTNDWKWVAYDVASARSRLIMRMPATKQQFTFPSEYTVGFSGDSRFLTLSSTATVPELWIHDLAHTNTTRACTNCWNGSLSADGRFLAYEAASSTNRNAIRQIYRLDRLANVARLVSRAPGSPTPGNARSIAPSISADGSVVVFKSDATNLDAGTANPLGNVYVWSAATDSLSTPAPYSPQDPPTVQTNPQLSADGALVAFVSSSDNLVPGDANQTFDVFLWRLGQSTDTDADGLDDAWELVHFKNLTETGGGDFDQDGASNYEEMRAGTDPASAASRFLATAALESGAAKLSISWTSQPGVRYQLQSTPSLAPASWSNVGESLTASQSTTATNVPIPAGDQAFYRILIVE